MKMLILAALLAASNSFDYEADKAFMAEVSGHEIMAFIVHQKREVHVLTKTPDKDDDTICKVLANHPKVIIQKFVNMLQKSEFDCTTGSI
jgi:hypothetical protein